MGLDPYLNQFSTSALCQSAGSKGHEHCSLFSSGEAREPCPTNKNVFPCCLTQNSAAFLNGLCNNLAPKIKLSASIAEGAEPDVHTSVISNKFQMSWMSSGLWKRQLLPYRAQCSRCPAPTPAVSEHGTSQEETLPCSHTSPSRQQHWVSLVPAWHGEVLQWRGERALKLTVHKATSPMSGMEVTHRQKRFLTNHANSYRDFLCGYLL